MRSLEWARTQHNWHFYLFIFLKRRFGHKEAQRDDQVTIQEDNDAQAKETGPRKKPTLLTARS